MDWDTIFRALGVVGGPTGLWAGWKFLKKQAREDMLNEDARKAVEAKNTELAAANALNAEKDRTIAELLALLDEATRPEGRR